MVDPVVNKGKVTVSTGYDAAATSIVLQTGDGAKLPDPTVDGAYNLPWYDSSNYWDPIDDPNYEIVRVTGPAGTGDTKTILRAQEGTGASTKNTSGATYLMFLGPTAKTITDLEILAKVERLWFPVEAAYLPDTNPATLTEEAGIGDKAGQSHADLDDTTAEHIIFRGPVIDYDGGNIVIVATAKAKTPPSAQVTLIFDIYAVGIASDESYDRAVTVDTGVDITFTFIFTELMPNQVDRDFSGASAWANVDLNAYDETDNLTITATVAAQYCTCPVASVPTTIGKRYCLEFDVANIVETWTIKSFDGTQTLGTVSANGANQQIEWIAETTGGLRIVAVANTSSGDFDNFSLTESDKMIKATATIDPANVADGDKIVIELIRNVADTLVGDGELIDFTTEYTRA